MGSDLEVSEQELPAEPNLSNAKSNLSNANIKIEEVYSQTRAPTTVSPTLNTKRQCNYENLCLCVVVVHIDA
jgi:hypothetical protein